MSWAEGIDVILLVYFTDRVISYQHYKEILRHRFKYRHCKTSFRCMVTGRSLASDDFIYVTGKMQNTSIMMSESDFSSEEETVFVNNKRPINGHLRNGLTKPKTKTKVRT